MLMSPVLVVCGIWGLILWSVRSTLIRLWREPVLRHPVLIVESDDWGPGPDDHVHALERIREVLNRHRDASGRPAVMSIAAVLAVSDNETLRAQANAGYADKSLDAPEFGDMLDALRKGHEQGVFALQLHGMTHFWPATLMRAAAVPGSPVAHWIQSDPGWNTEGLPPHVQSRWIDASSLPSGELADADIERAALDEVATFKRIFGFAPVAVVPPTFVWNPRVEAVWQRAGLKVLITPGKRYTGRGISGQPDRVDRQYLGGDRSEQGMTVLVRDVYFEPTLGHTAEGALTQADLRFALGRPALLETHRFNFTGAPETLAASLAELDRLLDKAVAANPDLRFMAPAELAAAFSGAEHPLIVDGKGARLQCWLRRVWRIGRLRKLACASGLVLPGLVLHLVTRSFQGQPRSARGLFQ